MNLFRNLPWDLVAKAAVAVAVLINALLVSRGVDEIPQVLQGIEEAIGAEPDPTSSTPTPTKPARLTPTVTVTVTELPPTPSSWATPDPLPPTTDESVTP